MQWPIYARALLDFWKHIHEGEPQAPPYNKFRAYFNLPLPYDEPTFKLFRAGQLLPGDREKQLNRTLSTQPERKGLELRAVDLTISCLAA